MNYTSVRNENGSYSLIKDGDFYYDLGREFSYPSITKFLKILNEIKDVKLPIVGEIYEEEI